MMSALLATKLHRPSPPAKRVQRSQLIERLDEGLAAGHRLTLVSAPAGFGKTTCVSEWLDSGALPVAWLSLEPADDDPGRFMAYLVAALQRVDDDLGREIAGLLQAGQVPPIPSLITALLNDILRLGRKFILVLDDFHVIRESAIFDALARLISGGPDNLHLVLVTREDPLLPLARLRANNQMTEIRAADLRFISDEANRLLNGLMELSLSEEDIAALENRTEGWVAGLQLAGLSARGRAAPSAFIANLSGNHRYILSYLTEEVLSRQPEEIQSFLLQTSILDRLNGELCNAVAGRTDGASLLERLFHANLFLIALDDEGQWYRYHHLFADLLAARLRQTGSEAAVLELHRRASTWLAQNGYVDEAVQHALAGKDYEQAALIVGQAARPMMFSGRVNVLKSWLEALPAVAFQSHPRLSIFRVWVDLVQGKSDLSEPALQRMDAMLRALPPSPENAALRMEMIVILCRFVAIAGNTSRASALAHEALGFLPDGDLASRARAYSALAIAYGLEGKAEEGRQAYRECLSLAQASANTTLAAHTMLLMGTWQCHYGQLSEAARTYQAIIELGEQAEQKVFLPAGQGHIGLASICLERHDLQNAQNHLTQGIELCGQAGLDGVFMGQILRSRLCQARGDLAGAMAELHALEQAFPRGDSFLMAIRQVQARLAGGDDEGVARWAAPLAAMLGAGPATARPPVVVLEIVQATIARVCLARGETERALQLLDELEATAEPGGRRGRMIEVNLLRALARQRQNDGYVRPVALEQFARALDLAEPEGYVALFLEEGPDVIPLLKAVLNQPAAPERRKTYARKLLGSFSGGSEPAASPAAEAAGLPERPGALGKGLGGGQEMIEPLSKREQENLGLICEGCSNREIAGQLVITVSAVKKHNGNIYGKLNVNSRTQAIARARRLGLLSVDG